MEPTVAAVMHLQAIVSIILRIPAEIFDAGVERRECLLHIIRMKTRTPRLYRIREVRLTAETDHAPELIRPDRIGNAEIRIDLHVPHAGVDRLVNRTQTEALIFQLLIHAVDQLVQLRSVRLAPAQLRKELIFLMSCNDLMNCIGQSLRPQCRFPILVNHYISLHT